MSAMDRNVAISIVDSKGELHEFVACVRDDGIWFGLREDCEVEEEAE